LLQFVVNIGSSVVHTCVLGILARTQASREKLRLRLAAVDGLTHGQFDQPRERLTFAKNTLGSISEFSIDSDGGKGCCLHGRDCVAFAMHQVYATALTWANLPGHGKVSQVAATCTTCVADDPQVESMRTPAIYPEPTGPETNV